VRSNFSLILEQDADVVKFDRGPLSNLTSMIPGMGDLMGGGTGEEAAKRMKRIAFIFDSMTTEELDSDGSLFRDPKPTPTTLTTTNEKTPQQQPSVEDFKPREPNKRVLRVARGSGTSVQEVEELLSQHHTFAMMAKKMGGKNGLMSKLKGAGGAGARPGAGGMPPMGAGGMPDLSKMSGGQMSALQVSLTVRSFVLERFSDSRISTSDRICCRLEHEICFRTRMRWLRCNR